MDPTLEVLEGCATALQLLVEERKLHNKLKRKRLERRYYCKNKNKTSVVVARVNNELPQFEDQQQSFAHFHGVSHEQFKELLALVEPVIGNHHTNSRNTITTHHCLSLTLRYLVTGKLIKVKLKL